MADENETKICDAVGLNGTESPAKSPADVLLLSFDREAFYRTPRFNLPAKAQPSRLYLMTCERFVKVGIAADPKKRWAGLQGANPFPVKLARTFGFVDRRYAWFAEQTCHRIMAGHRAYGEWFDVPLEVALRIVKTVVPAAQRLQARHEAEHGQEQRDRESRYQNDAAYRTKVDEMDAQAREWLARREGRRKVADAAALAYDKENPEIYTF